MRKSSLVAVLVVGALLVPLAVFASHQFNDVPDSHTFHNAIDWMKDNNITVGCNPPANTNFCPNDNVTRGQMSAFMKRLAENNVVDAATLDGIDSSGLETVVNGATDDFSTGAEPTIGPDVTLLDLPVDASVDGTASISGTTSVYRNDLPTGYVIWLQVDDATCNNFLNAVPGARAWGTVGENPATPSYSTVSFTIAKAMPAGSHTLTLCGGSLNSAAITVIESSLTSVFSASGSALAPQGEVTGGSAAPGE